MNLPRLTRQRWLARWSMLAERAWPEFSPVAALLVLFVCAALLDGPQRLPPLLHAAVLAVVVLSSVLLLRRGFLRREEEVVSRALRDARRPFSSSRREGFLRIWGAE